MGSLAVQLNVADVFEAFVVKVLPAQQTSASKLRIESPSASDAVTVKLTGSPAATVIEAGALIRGGFPAGGPVALRKMESPSSGAATGVSRSTRPSPFKS